jgi:cytochrome c
VVAGNTPATVSIAIEGNSMFFFPNSSVRYSVSVTDPEDGSTKDKSIAASAVGVAFDYVDKGTDLSKLGHQKAELPGVALIAASDCKSCHLIDQRSAGPSYRDVAKRYSKNPKAVEILSDKILKGGAGVWGETAMAAHPQLSQDQAAQMVEYILSLEKKTVQPGLLLSGVAKTGKQEEGSYVLEASYIDKGAAGVPSLTTVTRTVLKAPELNPGEVSELKVASKIAAPTGSFIFDNVKHNSSALFKDVDLTNVSGLEAVVYVMGAQTGGEVEFFLDGADGKMIGTTLLAKAPGIEVMDGVKMKSSKVALAKVSGRHDVLLIFKNDLAGDKNLFFFGKVILRPN